MSERERSLTLERKNLWAPWRMRYIEKIGTGEGCFICSVAAEAERDRENLVLWRTDRSLVMFNKFPYNNGHLLVCPLRHIPDFEHADAEEMLDVVKLVRETQKVLGLAIQPQGFNIGLNFGRCAGAGLPGHLHAHVVPRWEGDTNFMSVCTDTDVVSQSLSELYSRLQEVSAENNLPDLQK